jgi:hypothetical protein
MKMKKKMMIRLMAGIAAAGLVGLLHGLGSCGPVHAAEVIQEDAGVTKTPIGRPGADAVVSAKAFESGFSVVKRDGRHLDAIVVEPAQVTWIQQDGGQNKMWVREITQNEWVGLRGLIEETRGELGYTYKGNGADVDGSYVSLFETPDARGNPVMNGHGYRVKSLDAVLKRLQKLRGDGKANEATMLQGPGLKVLKARIGGKVVEKLPSADVELEVRREWFREGFVFWDAALWAPDREVGMWVVKGDQVTGAWWDASVKDGLAVGWRGRSWVLKKDEKEKVAKCLEGLSDKLGFAYENTRVRDGGVQALYASPDAKGPVVLKSTNAGIAELGELFVILFEPMRVQDQRKMPVVEDAQVKEVMERAVGEGKVKP